jgi:hypothetical protein
MLGPKQLLFLLSLLFPVVSEEAISQGIIPETQPLTQFLQIPSVPKDNSSIVQVIYPKTNASIINAHLMLLLEKTIQELQRTYSLQLISLQSQQKTIILSIKTAKKNAKKIQEVLMNIGLGKILCVTWNSALEASTQNITLDLAAVPACFEEKILSRNINYSTRNYVSEIPSSNSFKYYLLISPDDYYLFMRELTFNNP